MWRMYLCYCEAGFDERRIGVAQALLAKPLAQRYDTVSRAPRSAERRIASQTSAAR